MTTIRTILHVDMDAFFASVEQHDRPELRGKPVLVGHDGPRGVVAAASYEARAFGCRSAQPMAVAKRQCPHAVVVPVNGARYRAVSERVFAILEATTPLVEPLSIDEAFLDVTGSARLLGDGPTIAASLKAAIRADTGLAASIGVAPNKFLAKLASDWEKPDGLVIIDAREAAARIAPLSIDKMWGVGPVTAERLRRLGIRTFGDLAALDEAEALRRIGRTGDHLRRLARGEDDRPVVPDGQAKSIGHEQTFETDLDDAEHVRSVMLAQAESVGRRARRHGLRGRTVTVKIRFGDFETITRSRTLPAATDATDAIWAAARDLFDAWANAGYRPVRLAGVTLGNLEGDAGRQLDLFPDAETQRRAAIDRATDVITERFGMSAIHRGM